MNRSVLKHSCPPATSAAALVALLCALGGAAQAGLQVPITRPKQTLAASKTAVRALAFSADGKLLVTGAADGHLATWLLSGEQAEEQRDVEAHEGGVTSVLFSADAAMVFSGGADGAVQVRDVFALKLARRLTGHAFPVTGLLLGPLGSTLFSAALDGRIQQWDARLGTPRRAIQDELPVRAFALSPDGKLLATGGPDEATTGGLLLRTYDATTGRLLRRIPGATGAVSGLSFSADGRLLAAAHQGGVLIVGAKDADVWQPFTKYGVDRPAQAVAFRPDGGLVASGVGDRVVLNDGDLLRQTGEIAVGAEVTAIAWAPSGRLLAAAGADGSVKIYDVGGVPRAERTPAEAALKELNPALEARDKSKAAETLKRAKDASARFPKDAELAFAQALASMQSGEDLPALLAATRRAAAIDPDHYQSRLLLGIIGYQTKDWALAAPNLAAAHKLVPSSLQSLQMLAAIAGVQKAHEDGAELASRVVQLAPGDPSGLYNFACSFALRGRRDEALDWLEKAFQAGYDGFDGLKSDDDLIGLRGLPRYAELVAKYSGGTATASTAGSPAQADKLREQADALRKTDKYAEARGLYLRCIAEERAAPKPRESKIRKDLMWLAFCEKNLGNLQDARKHFEEANVISGHIGGADDDVGVFTRNLLGGVYEKLELFDKAVELYESSLRGLRERGQEDLIAVSHYNIAKAYVQWGRYDKAQDELQLARTFNESELKKTPSDDGVIGRLVANYDLQCDIFHAWGQTGKAIELARQGAAVAQKGKDPKNALDMVFLQARLYLGDGQYEQAIAAYQQAFQLATAKNDSRQMTVSQNGLSNALARAGRFQEALPLTLAALERARKSGLGLHVSLVATAQLHSKMGNYDKAIPLLDEEIALQRRSGTEDDLARSLSLYAGMLPDERRAEGVRMREEVLDIYQRRADLPGQAAVLRDLGLSTLLLERYDQSVRHLGNAVQILEVLRKTAQGEARRDYLAQSLAVYEILILAQLRNQDTPSAFRTMELSRAKLLAERIAGSGEVSIPAIAELPGLAGDGAILLYSNADLSDLVHFAINREGMQAVPKRLPEALKAALGRLPVVAQQKAERDRGLKLKGAPKRAEAETSDLEAAVEAYRRLLVAPGKDTAASTRELGRLLYDALIAPSLKYLKPGKPLLIAPDGVLAFLPFESLIDPQGRYLAETYEVHYIQSLSVLQALQGRKLPAGRKPLLAFGGAVYDQATYAKDMMMAREDEMFALADQVHQTLATRGSMRDAYSALGVKWENLPGTLREVKALQAIVPGSDVVSGEAVSERHVRQLSESGELEKYRVLHFATHGLVVPQLPELSALVLSQLPGASGDDDGYLLMGEISRLRLKADFVNLSACETGLGKVYGGEGVVGLTQAFLVAGANGLSVSLWQVPDESTSKFMQEVYRVHEGGQLGWPAAIAQVKRKFIAGQYGKAWANPHHWAPFVYYGQ